MGSEFVSGVNGLYDQIRVLAKKTVTTFSNATRVLEGTDASVYQPDGVHLTDVGNRIIALYMFNLVRGQLAAKQEN